MKYILLNDDEDEDEEEEFICHIYITADLKFLLCILPIQGSHVRVRSGHTREVGTHPEQ